MESLVYYATEAARVLRRNTLMPEIPPGHKAIQIKVVAVGASPTISHIL
jgi:hypothetical protein